MKVRFLTAIAAIFLSQSLFALDKTFEQVLGDIQQAAGGRLGVAVVGSDGKLALSYNAEQTFALCSTFKLPLAGLIFQRIDNGQETPSRALYYTADAILDYAPVAKRYLATGYMTVLEAVQAAVQFSDNTAANLLLESIGGPTALTQFFRALGDSRSHLDRIEPMLNTNVPNDPRDTTTPAAMASTVAKLVFGDVLTSKSRQDLQRLLTGNTTGDKTIRTGMPGHWVTGDKTGSCDNGGRNDIAFVIPTNSPPFALAIYTSNASATAQQRDEVIVSVAWVVAQFIAFSGIKD